MKQIVNGNVSLIEDVRKAMTFREWKQADLSRATGVSTGVISRFFNNDGISSDNLYKILNALELLRKPEAVKPSVADPVHFYFDTVEKRIDDLKARVDSLSEHLRLAVEERKTDINRIDLALDAALKRIDERFKSQAKNLHNKQKTIHDNGCRIDEITRKLMEFAIAGDRGPLKKLSGNG